MIKTLRSFDFKDKNVLLRVDFNVPTKNGIIGIIFGLNPLYQQLNTC